MGPSNQMLALTGKTEQSPAGYMNEMLATHNNVKADL